MAKQKYITLLIEGENQINIPLEGFDEETYLDDILTLANGSGVPTHLLSEFRTEDGEETVVFMGDMTTELNMELIKWFGHAVREYNVISKEEARKLVEEQNRAFEAWANGMSQMQEQSGEEQVLGAPIIKNDNKLN